jgi:hypothetical protein
MTLTTWEKLAPGRYATQVNGHSLQIIKNPDKTDPRRYVPVVNRTPVEPPSADLSAAKTRAINYAHRLHAERSLNNKADLKEKPAWKPEFIKLEPKPEPADEPFDPLGLDYAQFEEVAPEPEPEVLSLPAPEPEPPEQSRLSIDLTGITLTNDAAASIAAIRAAVELLREVPGAQDVRCRIHLPHPYVDV